MVKQAFLTSNCKTLNFMYKVPTDEFNEHQIISEHVQRQYEVDLAVDKHLEYPDISPSVWTLTLSIWDSSGDISQAVQPKAGSESLKSPGLVLVDWRIRGVLQGQEKEKDINKDPKGSDFYCHIGRDGFEDGEPVSDLRRCLVTADHTVAFRGRPSRLYHRLCKNPGVNVFISLMFMVEKTATCRVLETLYDSSLLADCKLICGGREFSAHRAILAALSPVFAAMFQTEMEEKSSGICTIKDTHPDVLDALLQFAYTGKITKADGKLEALWTAADKYDMEDLKNDCERLMLGSVTDDNAFEYLCFAKQRGLKRLKVEAAKVISQEPV